MPRGRSAIVIGAGIVGIACAHALADHGYEALILDKQEPAAGASRGNAGWIAHRSITPIASPKMLRQVPRFLLDPLGPLSIRPSYIVNFLPWLLRFLAAARPAAYKRSVEAIIALQALALPAWERRTEALGLSHLIQKTGALEVFDDKGLFERARPVYQRQRTLGMPVALLDGAALKELEPALDGRFTAGAFFEDVAMVTDPRLFTEALFDKATARGIRFQADEVSYIQDAKDTVLILTKGGARHSADRAVIAAGAWSKPLAQTLGDNVPLDTERGYNVSFPGINGIIARPIAFEGHGFVASPLAAGLRIGGAVEFAGLAAPPNFNRAIALHARARLFMKDIPAYETGVEWMGFRPSMPDSLPVIGPSTASPNVVYAFGHGHYGLTQAAATAELVADMFEERSSLIDLSPYSAQRF